MSKNTRNRILLTAVAALLLVVMSVAGTMAYLVANTPKVENTFTTSDIGLILKEHPLKITDGKTDGKTIDKNATPVDAVTEYKMVPGDTLQKDPFVTVDANSVDCWVFVEILETYNTLPSNSEKKYINYDVDTTSWTKLDGVEPKTKGATVYYYSANDATVKAGETKYILDDNQVIVDTAVLEIDMTAANTNKPQLTFYAYAIQKANVNDAATAWSYIVSGSTPTT